MSAFTRFKQKKRVGNSKAQALAILEILEFYLY